MSIHAVAREETRKSLVDRYGTVSDGEVKAVTAVGFCETCYALGWKGAGKGSKNKGAIQCGKYWAGERFSYVDTHPNADGSSTQYRVDFRKYPSDPAGWTDLVKVMFEQANRRIVRSAAQANDWYGVSKAMRQTGYYEGFGKTQEERIEHHYRALVRAIALADAVEVANDDRPKVTLLPATVEFGCVGESVRILQRELQIVADGIFGKHTKAAVVAYQSLHGLKPDGECGPITWQALFSDDYQPKAA